MSKQKDTQKLNVKAGLKSRSIKVDYLARVEGEGALYIELENQRVKDVQLKIFEPPRFFEAFLKGRRFQEAPDITARICGICPVAYQMSTVGAMENALGVEIPEILHQLRRLLYCGEWIESHALHIYMLHTPDFLGFDDAISMSKHHPNIIKDGLHIKKWGNEILKVFGGREIHPINVKVGGFYKIPDQSAIQSLLKNLYPAREKAFKAIEWFSKLDFPDFNIDVEWIALSNPNEYAMTRGRWISNKGLDIEVKDFEDHSEEFQVKHSTALHSRLKNGQPYLVGPLARYNLNRSQLSPMTHEAISRIQFEPVCTNPFRSIIVRSLEVLYAFDEAIRILEHLPKTCEPFEDVHPQAATGCAITEAPRGSLYHRYQLNEQGEITQAKIVPPTSQNQYTIENDLKALVKKHIHLPKDQLTWQCEQAIRNYDPCISCSTHFLKVHVHESL